MYTLELSDGTSQRYTVDEETIFWQGTITLEFHLNYLPLNLKKCGLWPIYFTYLMIKIRLNVWARNDLGRIEQDHVMHEITKTTRHALGTKCLGYEQIMIRYEKPKTKQTKSNEMALVSTE